MWEYVIITLSLALGVFILRSIWDLSPHSFLERKLRPNRQSLNTIPLLVIECEAPILFFTQTLTKADPHLWISSALLRDMRFQNGLGLLPSGAKVLEYYRDQLRASSFRLSRWMSCVRAIKAMSCWSAIPEVLREYALGIPASDTEIKNPASAKQIFLGLQALLKMDQTLARVKTDLGLESKDHPEVMPCLQSLLRTYAWGKSSEIYRIIPYPLLQLAPFGCGPFSRS